MAITTDTNNPWGVPLGINDRTVPVTTNVTPITTAQQSSLASSLGDNVNDIGKQYLNYQTGEYLEWQGTTAKFKVTGIGGAVNTYTEGGAGVGQSFNREDRTAGLSAIPGTGTPAKFTWVATQRPTKLDISLLHVTNGETYLWVVFDAASDEQADSWLQGEEGVAIDSQRYVVLPANTIGGESGEGKASFTFTSGVSNMYYILQAADATALLHVEAS